MIDVMREELWSVERTATFCGVHRRTIEKWFAIGLERITLGGRVFTTRNALQRFAKYSGPESSEAIAQREQNQLDDQEFERRFVKQPKRAAVASA